MKIAIAANYDVKNQSAWSGTPWSLWNGLCGVEDFEIETINLSIYHTERDIKKNILKNLDIKASIKQRAPVSKLGPALKNPLNSRILSEICRKSNFDAVIQFGGYRMTGTSVPYYIYTDSSHDMSLRFYSEHGHMPHNNLYSFEEMQRAADYVRPIYREAAGIFCMSNYLAETTVNVTGVDRSRVHTVYAGSNWHGVQPPTDIRPKSIQGKEKINLLFSGVDYKLKGTDIVIEALKRLNRLTDGRFTLHICGIKEKIDADENIINYGFVKKETLLELLRLCDIFVLPTRFDCFGIAFTEALTFGMPCVGRKICAIPEIIDEGKNGEMVTSDDPDELAALIMKIATDEKLYSEYSKNAIEKAKIFTWDRVCGNIAEIIKNNG